MNYNLKIEEILVPYKDLNKTKAQIINGDKLLYVEDFVQEKYEKDGYSVIKGADFHLFLWFSVGKFPNEVGRNWGTDRFVKLNKENLEICNNQLINTQKERLIENGIKMWGLYYGKYKPKFLIKNKLLEILSCFSEKEKIELLKIYSEYQYNPRGAPDLFAFKAGTKEKQFIEVKSYTDSLRYEQLLLASNIIRKVGDYYTLTYVLPNNINSLKPIKHPHAW